MSGLESIQTTLLQIQEDLQDQREKTNEIHKAIYVGNGRPALMIRLDRIEQRSAIIAYVVGVLFVATVGLAGRLVYAAITGG